MHGSMQGGGAGGKGEREREILADSMLSVESTRGLRVHPMTLRSNQSQST